MPSRRNIHSMIKGDSEPDWEWRWYGVDVTGYVLTLQIQLSASSLYTVSATVTETYDTETGRSEFKFEIDTSSMEPGIYPARLYTDQGSGVQPRTFEGFWFELKAAWS